MKSTLKDYMPASVREALGNRPTTHNDCLHVTETMAQSPYEVPVARPGKTARDRAKKEAADNLLK